MLGHRRLEKEADVAAGHRLTQNRHYCHYLSCSMHRCYVVDSSPSLPLCPKRHCHHSAVVDGGVVEGDDWWWLVGENLEVGEGRGIVQMKGGYGCFDFAKKKKKKAKMM